MASFKHLFSRSLSASPGRLHFAAHSHHLWPDASYDAHMAAWDDAASLADKKWDKVFGEIMPQAQREIAAELKLPDPATIAFAPSTHELLTRLFSARKQNGPIDVLTSDGEFHSFRRQSARWEEDGLIRRRIVACEPFESFTPRFLQALDEQTPDIAFVSHVMFKSGLRFDGATELARRASPNGMWAVLDLYHSFMAIPCDFGALADRVFLIGGGYKYAMAGEGACYLHAPPGFAPRPAYTGWFADFGAIEARQGEVAYSRYGGRFLGATFDPTALYRFNAVRAMLAREDLDTTKISAHCGALREQLITAIKNGDAGILSEAELLMPNAHGPLPRFVSLRHPLATTWKAKLMSNDIITDARDDVLRIGLGLYHDAEDVTALCERVGEVLG